jgi:hypothetical protein
MRQTRIYETRLVRTSAKSKRDGSACWARTSDPLINSQLLYQLS